ncbi:FkbM family methyltransferase [Janthinobacterium sp. 35]|uniref:FkbM family methyltransferase n=1 Tax=Janthinobacterium sp. 35 TaxID=2035210 RepID=UPI0015D4C468
MSTPADSTAIRPSCSANAIPTTGPCSCSCSNRQRRTCRTQKRAGRSGTASASSNKVFPTRPPDAGSASAVSAAGSSSIEVTTLDLAVTQAVSFIKMDLEGWEMQALAGSQRHIRAEHPKLAISVYHNAADFHRIPDYIASIRQDYDLYLRHYTQGWSETIMYFVPRRNTAQSPAESAA